MLPALQMWIVKITVMDPTLACALNTEFYLKIILNIMKKLNIRKTALDHSAISVQKIIVNFSCYCMDTAAGGIISPAQMAECLISI